MSKKKSFRLEQYPDMLIGYSGNEHLSPETYQRFFDAWVKRLAQAEPFGVIMVHEPHEHHEDEGRDADEEDAFTRILNNFRRDYRQQANKLTTGFSRVFPPQWLGGISAEKQAQHRRAARRMAEYMFGVRGQNFSSLEQAKTWIQGLKNEAPLPIGQSGPVVESTEIGLYYGSTTGMTEMVAEKMQAIAAQEGLILSPVNISNLKNPTELLAFNQIIMGIPTWNIGQLQDDWLLIFPRMDALDFRGKQVALFGVGDQVGYPDNFLDALGTLGNKLQERGAELVGSWSAEDYTFANSKAFVDGRFIGLGIDEYNQEEKTEQRIKRWLEQIQEEFKAQEEFQANQELARGVN